MVCQAACARLHACHLRAGAYPTCIPIVSPLHLKEDFKPSDITGGPMRCCGGWVGKRRSSFVALVSTSPEFGQWLESERNRLRLRAHDAALKLSASRQATGDWEVAVKWMRFALNLAPDDESTVQRLMQLLHRSGDRASALRAYESFAQ